MSWLDQLNETIESTSSALKTSRVSSSKPNTSFTSFRTPLTVTEVQNTPSSTRQAWNENTNTISNSTTAATTKHNVSQKLLLQDVSAVKSAVVQVAAEVGRHAQSTIETNGSLQRLGDDQQAQQEVISSMRQRVIDIESQRTQQIAAIAELRRSCDALRQQYAHLQASINERATRGEVSASIQATILPVRSQVESALQHYSEGLATATATAAAAVHAANDAKRRVISQRVTNTSMSFHPSSSGDPEFSMTGDETNTSATSNNGIGSRNSNGSGGQHATLMNSIDIIEARVERRMLRSIEDKIELEMSRASDRGSNVFNFSKEGNGKDGKDGKSGNGFRDEEGNSTTSTSIESTVFKAWQLDLEGKVQECFQRVLEQGGKLAEESQRRHLGISAARAETRIEGKRIDELTATVSVAEREMRETTESITASNEKSNNTMTPHEQEIQGIAALLGSSTGTVTAVTKTKKGNDKSDLSITTMHETLRDFVTSSTFASAVQQIIDTEVEDRVNKAVLKLSQHFDATVAKLEQKTLQKQTAFETQWSSKFDSGMETNDSEMEEIRDDHEKMQHDVKALRKMMLEQKGTGGTGTGSVVGATPSSSSSSGTMDTEALTAMKRANAAQIQRAQNRFDRQLQELRTDLSSKHATHDRVLAKIEESVGRAMSLTLKASDSKSKDSKSKGIKPPTKPKGPPPPNAKRAPGAPPPPSYGSATNSNNHSSHHSSHPSKSTMSATAALKQASKDIEVQEKEKASELKFQEDVKRTRAMLNQQKKKTKKGNSSHATAPSVASSLLAPPATETSSSSNSSNTVPTQLADVDSNDVGTKTKKTTNMKKAMEERQQCPFCLKRFEASVLVSHKINCDCRTVHCQYCGKGRMARQLKTHEQFCDQNPKNASKSEKKKCKHCDKFFSAPQLAAHRCDWEPRQCKHCGMQIIARDISRHEDKCAAKLSRSSAASSAASVEDDSVEAEEPRCCSFGDCDCRRFVPSTSSRVRPSHPHLICSTCGHGALYHQSPDASKALALRSSAAGIEWAKEFSANLIADSPIKKQKNTNATNATNATKISKSMKSINSNERPPTHKNGSVGQKLASASGKKKKKTTVPSALMQVAAEENEKSKKKKLKHSNPNKSNKNNKNNKSNKNNKNNKNKKRNKKSSPHAPPSSLDSAVSGISSEKSALLEFVNGETESYTTSSRKSHSDVHPSAWTVDQVCDWLASHGIAEKIRDKFSEQVIDGFMLLNTGEDDIVQDLKISGRSTVNRLLSVIQLLKAKAKKGEDSEDGSDGDSSDFEHESEEEYK